MNKLISFSLAKAILTSTITVMLITPGLLHAAKPVKPIDPLTILVDSLVVCPPRPDVRFVDNGDGTICDHQTGLMWEKKDASDGTADLNNPHDVDNSYTWSSDADGNYSNPDGTAFTDFLPRLNGVITNTIASNQLGGHSDWRLPTIAELQTILDCSFPKCIDPTFGPTAATFYWSSTSDTSNPEAAWHVDFDGGVFYTEKGIPARVRAVRGGR